MPETSTIDDTADFEALWNRYHPARPPIGWMMRRDERVHWVRFHSLPLSKRYPGSPVEWTTLLDRQNRLAAEVLGDGPCWLVQAHYQLREGELLAGDPDETYRATNIFGLAFAFDFEDPDEGDPPVVWRVHAGRTRWSPPRFQDTLRAIANDVSRALWMAEADGAVFAPYDGGVDIFLPDAAGVDRLRRRYADWLPDDSAL